VTAGGGETLLLVWERTGPRHVLCGRPVHSGAVLEVLASDKRWVRGTYRWSFDPDDDPSLEVEEMWRGRELRLDPDDVLRWPDDPA
jgi:hypothetical protein